MNALLFGAVSGGLAVVFGAFGAHALAERLTDEQLSWWDTGVRYQAWHALALLAVGVLGRMGVGTGPSGWLFAGGTLIFSGTLYAMALGGPRWFGAITPIGGLLLIAGWATLAWSARGA